MTTLRDVVLVVLVFLQHLNSSVDALCNSLCLTPLSFYLCISHGDADEQQLNSSEPDAEKSSSDSHKNDQDDHDTPQEREDSDQEDELGGEGFAKFLITKFR